MIISGAFSVFDPFFCGGICRKEGRKVTVEDLIKRTLSTDYRFVLQVGLMGKEGGTADDVIGWTFLLPSFPQR